MSTFNKTSDILIIVPAYHEERNLPKTVADLKTNFPSCDILVVDDASKDSTYQVAKGLDVTVLSLPVNLGIGGAVQTGFIWAVKHNYQIAIQFDGDGQHQASLIPKLIKTLNEHDADLAIGSRYSMGRSEFKTTFSRRCGMIIFAKLFRLFTGLKLTDTTSGFRAYGKDLLKFYIYNYPVDFPDMPALLAAHVNGFKIVETPVEMNQRQYGVSSTGLLKSLWYPFRMLIAVLNIFLNRQRVKT